MDKVSRIKLFEENKGLLGLNVRHLLYQQGGADTVRRVVEKVWGLWREGKITPRVDSTWAWEDVSLIIIKKKLGSDAVILKAQAIKILTEWFLYLQIFSKETGVFLF